MHCLIKLDFYCPSSKGGKARVTREKEENKKSQQGKKFNCSSSLAPLKNKQKQEGILIT